MRSGSPSLYSAMKTAIISVGKPGAQDGVKDVVARQNEGSWSSLGMGRGRTVMLSLSHFSEQNVTAA